MKLVVQIVWWIKRYFPVVVTIILLTSFSTMIAPVIKNTESESIISTQGSTLSTTTSTPSSGLTLSISSATKTNSDLEQYASNSQLYFTTSSNLSSLSATIPSLWLNLNKRRRRVRSQIYIEILELMKERGPMTPFEITLYARLNHKRTKECITFLSLCNYLQQTGEMDGRFSYVLTKEGLKFLERVEVFLRGNNVVANEVSSQQKQQYSFH